MLTTKEQAVLSFIHQYHSNNGRAPLLTEIAKSISIRSKGVAHRYVKSLSDKGYVMTTGRHRGISVTGKLTDDLVQAQQHLLPFLGKIAAGQPIEAIPDHENINMMDFFVGPDRFVLKVVGDSMINAGILDGDMVVVRKAQTAANKDIIVALIDNHEATLKYFQNNRDGSVTLVPANSSLFAVKYDAARVSIQGVVVGQMRVY